MAFWLSATLNVGAVVKAPTEAVIAARSIVPSHVRGDHVELALLYKNWRRCVPTAPLFTDDSIRESIRRVCSAGATVEPS
jgi:hypothetical protein